MVSFNLLADFQNPRQNIDFVLPMDAEGNDCETWLPPKRDLEQNVKEISFTDPISGYSKVIYRGSGTRTVRFIKAPLVCKEDFRTMLQVSEGVVGCTGDNSLVEAISTGNPWLYETRNFKNAVLEDLQNIAKDFFKDQHDSPFLFYLLNYNKKLTDQEYELIAQCISDPQMRTDAKSFAQHLKQTKDITQKLSPEMDRIIGHKRQAAAAAD